MKTWTINSIQTAMTNAGSHWFDRGTMRWFNTRVGQQVYQGEGGIYFVTSEKPPHGPRRYSIRQFRPDAEGGPDIDTAGEFCEMSRSQAHRQAAKLAGPSAIIAQEAHKPIGEAEQLAIDVERGGGHGHEGPARWLIHLATIHHRAMEDYCNGVDIYDQDGEPLPKLAKLRAQIEQTAEQLGCGVMFSGDPRGATVKLILPNKATNSMGGEGWCVPTKD